MAKHDRDPWLDSQMRDVPLPAGLNERLRAIGFGDDPLLDRALRAVDVPDELADRLQAIVEDEKLDRRLAAVPVPEHLAPSLLDVVADESLDRRLCEVTMPEGLAARVRAVVDDECLDERLRDVRIPVRLAATLRRWRRRVPVGQLAMAASLLLMIGASYFIAMFGLITSAYRTTPVIWGGSGGIELESITNDDEGDFDGPGGLVNLVPDERSADEDGISLPPIEDRLDPGRLAEINGLFPRDAMERVDPFRGTFGFAVSDDDGLPELAMPPRLLVRGAEVPAVRGYDRRFLLKHGIHPKVSPGLHQELRVADVPLSPATDSFDLVRRVLAQGRMPPPEDVVVEDFLAAVEYGFMPPAPGELGIRTAGGPSIFSDDGAGLLQIGVRAGPVADRPNVATHLAVAVDTSASMDWGGRRRMVQRALRRLARRLGPDDRFSLVAFSDQAEIVFKNERADDVERLIQAIDERLVGGGATHLGAGIRTAASILVDPQTESGTERRLVVVSDGISGLSKSVMLQLGRMLEAVADDGVELHVVDVGQGDGVDPTLAATARLGRGRVDRAETTDRIEQILLENLLGTDPVVATDAHVRVTFNPKAVIAYRLLGHEAAFIGAAGDSSVRTTLRAGQSATALFEVWLDAGSEDDVAVAELIWRDPADGRRRSARQRVSRLQFATSAAESAVSLQAAAVTAELAEILRESVFVRQTTGSVDRLLEAAGRVHSQLLEEPTFQDVLELARQAQALGK